jgi:DNA-binding SARP family transcriptional activator
MVIEARQPVAGGPPVRLTLLDGFLVIHGDEPVTMPMALQRLIAFLGLRPGSNRTHVAGLLWPDMPEDRALGCLRTTLWRLRRDTTRLVDSEGQKIRLGRHVRVDVDELVRIAQAVQAGGNPRVADPLLATGQDELLPGWYDDWVLFERERLRQLRLHALEAAARAYLRLEQYGRALQAAIAAMRAEPLRETPYRLVVEVHLTEGNAYEALRAYHKFHDLVRRELGLTPSPQMQALLARVLRIGVRVDEESDNGARPTALAG